MKTKGFRPPPGLSLILALAVWELASRAGVVSTIIPAPTAIAIQFWADRSDYALHLGSTLTSAVVGLLVGNAIGILFAIVAQLVPIARLGMGLLTFVYSIPLILLVPVLGMTLSPDLTRITAAALLVYYPTLLIMSVALGRVPSALNDVVLACGGNSSAIFWKLRTRYGLDGLAVGLQTSAPLAILGSMLGELTGARWGLGAYLLAVMAQGKPEKEWAVFAVCVVLSVVAFMLTGMLLKPLRVPTRGALGTEQKNARNIRPEDRIQVLLRAGITVVGTAVIWQSLAAATDLGYFVKGPIQVVRFALTLPVEVRSEFIAAVYETLRWSAAGLLVGLLTAFVLAILFELLPFFASASFPFILISQAVPIVALVPLYVTLFGRGVAMTLAVIISASFFPSFVAIHEGIRQTPQVFTDVVRSAGGSKLKVLWMAKLPAALPFLYAGARLAAPRVLLGISLAEYLATRKGVGALMFEARGKTDFGMMWLIATVVGIASVLFYYAVKAVETHLRSKYGTVETGSVL